MSSTNFTWSILVYFVPHVTDYWHFDPWKMPFLKKNKERHAIKFWCCKVFSLVSIILLFWLTVLIVLLLIVLEFILVFELSSLETNLILLVHFHLTNLLQSKLSNQLFSKIRIFVVIIIFHEQNPQIHSV